MDKETLDIANKIKGEIEKLQKEISVFPRYILDPKEYEKSGRMYIKRFLVREKYQYNYKLRFQSRLLEKNVEYELSEEDLQSLVNLRLQKIKKLEKELEKL